MNRMNITILLTAILFMALAINPVAAQDQTQKADALRKAYGKVLLPEVDNNKDGKISLEECRSMWKYKAKGESKCKYWDRNGDGIITEEEYVQQGLKIMK